MTDKITSNPFPADVDIVRITEEEAAEAREKGTLQEVAVCGVTVTFSNWEDRLYIVDVKDTDDICDDYGCKACI